MDNKERIKQLEKFIREEPGDPFNIYALALEYLSIDKLRSEELFDELLIAHPEYVSSYYHAAALQESIGNQIKAESIYKAGIEMAEKVKNAHALKELQSAYLNFQFESD